MIASSERRMREIRMSGATSGGWKRNFTVTAPVLDSTKFCEPRCDPQACRQTRSEGRSTVYESEDRNDAAGKIGHNPSGRG